MLFVDTSGSNQCEALNFGNVNNSKSNVGEADLIYMLYKELKS